MSREAAEASEMSNNQHEEENTMQTDPVEANNKAENSWTYDAGSGRTIETESAWITRNKKEKKNTANARPPENPPTGNPPIAGQTLKPSPSQQQRRPKMPPLPLDDFKIVYRPQAGLELAKWNTVAVMHAIGRASGLSQQDFNDKVRVQVQRTENLIIASTAAKEDAKKLVSIKRIQLGGNFYNVNGNVRTPDDVSRGVISGLIPGTSTAELMAGIRAPARYTVLHARMLGQSTAAVVFFEGPHVPYYIIFQSVDFRCRPYRKSVQYCRTCGNTGHRQDICPRPIPDFCYKCGKAGQTQGHECQPTCKICGEGHETASKECKRRLKPNPPPYNIRQQRLNRIQEIDNHWSCSGEEYPGLGTSAATSSSSSAGSSTRRSRSKSILRSTSHSRSHTRSRSVKRASYAAVASGSSGSSSSTFSSAETASIQVLEDGLQNQQRKLQNQHSQLQNQQNLIDKLLQSQKRQQELIDKLLENCKVQQEISYNTHQQRQDLEDTSSQPRKTLPKADVQAIVDARCKIFQEAFMSNIHATMEKVVQSAIEKTAATFEQKITTLNAKIDGIAAQVNNFIAHVKKTYVTIAQFDSFSNPRQVTRKKARANSHNASRSVSPTRDRRRDIESVEDGNP
ncbi:hypothetical protein HPB52_011342 [Rhipicephalus sanguineus]|uniref:CCHC-type domain-containing protein n=1 Tax=Rhipicephalus sanguineus TaxID=34632 RepID=A0A9D4T9N0_RHISA|nr:hypothetical protein HPB52_011342 [Rhipicephalus sanguineus]